MERLPKFQTGGFISDKTIFTDVNVGHGIEFIQKQNTVTKNDKIVEAIKTSINNLLCIKECKTMKKQTVSILGTEYMIEPRALKNEDIDGFTDNTLKLIVIRSDNANNVGDFEYLQKKQLRHEIIHAFMSESGLQCNWQHIEQFGHDETTVDWFAIQSPKIFKVFQELDIL